MAEMSVPYHLLTMTATVSAPTQTFDVTGAPVISWGSPYTVPCLVQPDSSTDAIEWQRNTGKRVSTGFFPLTHDGTTVTLLKDQRVQVGSASYRVVGPARDSAGQAILQTVSLEEDF